MQHYSEPIHINVGTGADLTIRQLAELIRGVVYPEARLVWDTTKPDGAPRKLLDVSRLHGLGWRHQILLQEGIEATYRWYLANLDRVRTHSEREAATV
jgi:GDP-L-fucose synthase